LLFAHRPGWPWHSHVHRFPEARLVHHLIAVAHLLDVFAQTLRKETEHVLLQFVTTRATQNANGGILYHAGRDQRCLLLCPQEDHSSRSEFCGHSLDELSDGIAMASGGKSVQLVEQEDVVHPGKGPWSRLLFHGLS